ncbi:MAG: hypothetical protein WCD18_25995 [Thermosynechococcaceae cyanobacterium]
MRRVSYISIAPVLWMSLVSSASAASLSFYTAEALFEQPLIPLEKSLVPETLLADIGSASLTSAVPDSVMISHNVANALVRGLLIANRTGEISFRDPLSYQVQDVVRRLRRGESVRLASAHAHVPLSTLERLLSLDDPNWEMAVLLADSGGEDLLLFHTMANALVRGLLIANRTGEIGYAAPLSYKVQDIVRNLRRGEPLTVATGRAGVPGPVVDRLLHLGNYPSAVN